MAIPYVNDYKKGNYVFPEDNLPFSKKDEKWHKRYMNAILADYANDKCGILYSERERILANRAWAEGTNSTDTFKDIILEYNRDEGERQAYSSIDYDIIPVIAQIKSKFVGILSNINHKATANAIDPVSRNKRTIAKEKLWIKANFPELGVIDKKLGIKPKKDEYLPQSRAELDMYDQFGGFKLGLEVGLEAGLKHCFGESRWDDIVRPQLLGDVFDNKMMACRDYFDVNTYTNKLEYVDIANAIVQASKSPTYDDARYKGFIKYITIADLRVLTADQPGWDEDKIMKIAKKYSGQNGNKQDIVWGAVAVDDQYGFNLGSYSGQTYYQYDPYLIPIAVIEFQSTMYEYDVEKKDAAGNISTYKTDRDRKYNRSDRKSITTPIKVWHKASLVIGCDEIFDWGLQHNIPRPTHEDARSSFHFFRLKGLSYCERAIPHAKQIQLMYLKIQGLALKAVPPGVAIEWGALKGMIINNKELDPYQIMKIYGQTGNLIWKGTNVRGHQLPGTGNPPLKELRGSYTLADLLGVIMDHKSSIKELIGIDDQSGVNAPTAYQAKLSSLFTNLSIKECFNAYLAVVKDTAINAAARLRDLLAYSEKAREIYGPIIGLTNMELLDMVSDLPTAHIALEIEIEPTEEDIQFIMDAAVAAMKPGKNGEAMFQFSDLMLVHRMAKTGMTKFAQAYIADKEQKAAKAEMAREQQNQQMNGEIAAQQEQLKAQNKMAELQAASQLKVSEYDQQVNKDMERDRLLHEQNKEIERMRLEQALLSKQSASV